MFSSALVCLFICQQDCAKTTQSVSTKFGGKLAHGPRKKPLDFGGKPARITLGLGLGWVMVMVRWVYRRNSHGRIYVT